MRVARSGQCKGGGPRTDASSDPVASKLSLKGFHAVSNTAPEWPLIRGAPRGSLPTAV